ncbi:MAG: LLM class flavin-dependent oxidoreductase [Proteiniphilum sp.]|jgi:luciferase family oxidoreductase group 1|nr:LLM class flavin-dependent oxidoreductase [Proteiniphilum sp.]MDD2939111.1 LLM class flavin-dependent oxidoreductase [Proteiniphilum sp.]
MLQNLKFSILDLAYYTENDPTPGDVLQHSTEVARMADKLGYHRYWFAEHHNSAALMSMFPEIMIAHVAANTEHIRVGSGGVMLPNHSALSVAERFSMLEALHPGRIDLGIGRAPGTDGRTALALRRSWEIMKEDTFPGQLDDLLGYLAHNLPVDHPFSKVIANPDPSLAPDIYMLGSSGGGVQFALEKGLGFVFAGQINAEMAVPVLKYYRDNFKPSIYYDEPRSILSISVFTADTEEEANYLAAPTLLMWTLLSTGKRFKSFPTSKEANDYPYTLQEKAIREQQLSKFVIGTPGKVAEQLHDWADKTGVNEIMLVDGYAEMEARKNGYALLAKEFGL